MAALAVIALFAAIVGLYLGICTLIGAALVFVLAAFGVVAFSWKLSLCVGVLLVIALNVLKGGKAGVR